MKNPTTIPSRVSVVIMFLTVVALAHISNARAQDSDEINKFRLAQSYEQGGRHEDALRFFADLNRYYPGNAAYFDGVRRCLVQLKRYQEADSLVTERIARQPREQGLYVARGSIRYKKGEEGQGAEDWKRAIAINPRNAGIYTTIADEAVNLRQYDQAVITLRQGRKALENDQIFTFEIARALMMGVKFKDAMSEYLRYLVAVPSSLGQIQQQIAQFSQFPEALTAATVASAEAVQEHRASVEIRHLHAWLLMEAKDFDAAFEVYREIDRLRNANGNELFVFAERARENKAWLSALQAYRVLMANYPKSNFSADAALHYARCIEVLARDTAHRSSNQTVVDVDLSLREAIQLYRKVRLGWPNHPAGVEAGYRTALLLARDMRDYPGALEELTPLLLLRRRFTNTLDGDLLLAEIHLLMDETEKALEMYRSLTTTPTVDRDGPVTARFRMAEIAWFQGRFEDAIKELEPLTRDTRQDMANDALALLLVIQQHVQSDSEALRLLAQSALRLRQQRYEEAGQGLEGILKNYPNSAMLDRVVLELGQVMEWMGREDSAMQCYDRVTRQFPESIYRDDALYHAAVLQADRIGDSVKAQGIFQQLLEEYPNSIFSQQARERIQVLRKGQS